MKTLKGSAWSKSRAAGGNAQGRSGVVRILRWTKGMFAGLVVVFGALIAAGLIYQAIALEVDERRYPPPGEMVDVGGYRLHLNVMGKSEGGPAVILDAGAQSASFQWGWVQPRVAGFARVVSYDRPGTGWSEAPPEPIDAHQLAEDLHQALYKAGVRGPYVVVGHSMGSLTARAFAERYPDEVKGAVLVDPRYLSMHEDFLADFPEENVPTDPPLAVRMQAIAARLGIVRVLDPLGGYAEWLPSRQAAEARAYVASDKLYDGMWSDIRLAESAVPALRNGEQFQKKPVIVLSAGEPDPMNFPGNDRRAFTVMHERMASSLSTLGEHRVVEGSDHLGIVADRDHAKEVSGAIRQVVRRVQEG